MNNEEKKRYIYENIENINNSELIFNFIKNNNIEYSKNNNGIYFNLSCINDEIIAKFYNFIFLIKNNEFEHEVYNKLYEDYIDIINNKKEIKKNNIIKYDEIKINKLQKEILNTIN